MSAIATSMSVRFEQLREPGQRVDALVLASTFEPRGLPSGAIFRERLVERLSRDIRNNQLTLLSAPAGAGKTVLAASWAASAQVSYPVAWLTVDDVCDKPLAFWQCVIEALSLVGADLPRAQRGLADEPVPRSFFMNVAADILSLPGPVVLVLDLADRALGPEITAGLDFLLRHADPQFRLVVCGRMDPDLPLHRYRLADSVAELRQDALAFTVAEAEELLASFDVFVSSDIAAALTESTEGWAAGLRLAASALQEQVDPNGVVEALTAEHGSISEYLVAEVLDIQSPQVRQFLLRTSVAEQLWPDLVDHLTGRSDGRRTLATLVRANAFVERSQQAAGAYRVHPLFRALLKAQLADESPEEIPDLHRRCADWLGAAGQTDRAIEHAIEAFDWAQACDLLIESFAVGSLLAHDPGPYSAIVDAMPVDLRGDKALLLRTAARFTAGQRLEDAVVARVASLARDETCGAALRISAAATHAAIAADEPDSADALEAADAAEELLALIPTAQITSRRNLVAVIVRARAAALMRTGAADATADALHTAYAAGTAAGSSHLSRACLADLALVEAMRGRLGRAENFARDAEQRADEGAVPRRARPASAPLALTWVNCEQNHHTQAHQWLAIAHESATGRGGTIVAPLLAVVRARLLRSRREFEPAAHIIESVMESAAAPPWVREREALELASLRVAQAEPRRALAVLDALPDPNTPHAQLIRRCIAEPDAGLALTADAIAGPVDAPLDVLLDAEIGLATRLLERGESSRAVTVVLRALQRGEPEQIRRPFIDSSPQLRKLLRVTPTLREAGAWLARSAPTVVELRPVAGATRPAQVVSSPPPAVEALTEREMDVLRLLSELMSTTEIAATMFVSVNTVKTHIRSILRKLAVGRRNEAVRRAREMALV